MSAVERVAVMMTLIPQRPASITVRSLVGRLSDAGFVAHHRSVQRDLVVVSRLMPGLIVESHRKPFRWSWSAVCRCPWVQP